ncbi:hypothetical protein QBZ16_005469 [Prototheca wickerhamii]|uniref:Trehalose 6-phosphate phosphatase n=1 Tax=Prototheca wickerhamii TaxID=3111 RepID=A0AAD9MGE8_PROWI|nr:hypothetical protein QBZ16_005469 [Prototheca wickerhamii]
MPKVPTSRTDDAQFREWQAAHPCPCAEFDSLIGSAAGKTMAVFLDYDGTLTPIVSDPDAAVMSARAREAVAALAALFPTAIVSGRSRAKVESFVRLRSLFYAGSHGMDIVGPSAGPGAGGAPPVSFQPAAAFAPLMARVIEELRAAVRPFAGTSVEDNTFCLSVHFRNASPDDFPRLLAAVEGCVAGHRGELRLTRGRKVLEVRPQLDWDKGAALLHLLESMALRDAERVFSIYIGDDRTDEDAFKALARHGLGAGILVSTCRKETAASWCLAGPDMVLTFLERLVQWGRTPANLWHEVRACSGWHIGDNAGAD